MQLIPDATKTAILQPYIGVGKGLISCSVDAVLDAGKGKVTMNLNGKKYTYNFIHASKHPTPFPPEDEVEEVDSLCLLKPLETCCKER
jgi:hypothetical protein